MITKIGVVSGEIWRLLEKEDKLDFPTLLTKVEKNLSEDRDLVCMSVGWLAREGHIVMKKKGSGYILYLRKPSLETS
jgi:hypothetical protein